MPEPPGRRLGEGVWTAWGPSGDTGAGGGGSWWKTALGRRRAGESAFFPGSCCSPRGGFLRVGCVALGKSLPCLLQGKRQCQQVVGLVAEPQTRA